MNHRPSKLIHKMKQNFYFSTMNRILFFLLFVLPSTAIAQTYWQQKVDTRIDVTLDDRNHTLAAYEEITYTNNSPDTLKSLFFHLWPNAYKNDHTPFAKQDDRNGKTAFYYSKENDKGYIDSLQFTVNGVTAEHYATEDAPDIARLDLPTPLYPGATIRIATPFKVKIPTVFSRLGHTKQAYFISQWFPKPAVYDRKGWHPISYLDQGEFFSEYGSYDVTITLPANYVVMATGNCMSPKESDWLDAKAHEELPKDTLYKSGWFPASASELKTISFHEDNVHDFAWFADKRWAVMKDSVMSPGTHQWVTTWSAFLPAYKKSWKKSNFYLKETILNYGKWVGPYPYKTVKAVLGDMHAGGGMEYPTVTIIDKGASGALKTVVVHEAGHNWFYGILGSMERDHAWMDEGMNTFYEKKTTRAILPDSEKVHHNAITMSISGLNEEVIYAEMAATGIDQAVDQNADNFVSMNYGIDVYNKTNLMMRWLEHYMDSANFDAGMKEYFATWKFRHPYPEDFMAIMKKHTAKNIDWFLDQGLRTEHPVDFKISAVEVGEKTTNVWVTNNTDFYGPVGINAMVGDSVVAYIWSAPFTGTTSLTIPNSNWSALTIDKSIPDYRTTNNMYRRSALFHNSGFGMHMLTAINQNYSSKVYFAPALGYNQYDGIMAGLVFHDFTVPEHRFKFAVAPMYGFNSGTLVGMGSLGYTFHSTGIFREPLLQVDMRTFHDNHSPFGATPDPGGFLNYTKIAPSLTLEFAHAHLSTVRHEILFKFYHINEQTISWRTDSSLAVGNQNKVYGLIAFSHKNNRTYNPFGYKTEIQAGADFAKINVEGNVRIDYNQKNKSMFVRGYFGKFIPVSNDPAVASRYYLNASFSGVNDYLFDGTYPGRNAYNNVASQQVSIQEGGFKIPVFNNAARSDNWMATINIQTTLPKTKLLLLYLDAGLIPNANPGFTHSGSTTFLYEGGIEARLIKNLLSIYVPVIRSADFDNYLVNTWGQKKAFAHSVSFTLELQQFNWLKSPMSMIKI